MSETPGFSYYDILGVSRSATAAEIKSAYHAALLKFHPDVNNAPNAQRLTEAMNEAYQVLRDPESRQSYDLWLSGGGIDSPEASTQPGEPTWDLYTCDTCGKLDPHLRFAVFYRVFSLIVWSQMNGVGGVLCPQCRSKHAISTALFSAFLGPWGFPWGIIYTIKALYTAIRGGSQPRLENAQLLRHLGVAFWQREMFSAAKTALLASLGFEKNAAVTAMLNENVMVDAVAQPGAGFMRGQGLAVATVFVPIILLLLLFGFFGSSGSTAPAASDRAAVSSSPGLDVGAALDSRYVETDLINSSSDFTDAEKTCLLSNNGRQSNSLTYSACQKASTQEQQFADATSDYHRKGYHLVNSTVFQFYEALEAMKLSDKATARATFDQAYSRIRTLRDTISDDTQRARANRYYSCWTNLDKCTK